MRGCKRAISLKFIPDFASSLMWVCYVHLLQLLIWTTFHIFKKIDVYRWHGANMVGARGNFLPFEFSRCVENSISKHLPRVLAPYFQCYRVRNWVQFVQSDWYYAGEDVVNPLGTNPTNGQTHSNNSSANSQRIAWVCLTILCGRPLKG